MHYYLLVAYVAGYIAGALLTYGLTCRRSIWINRRAYSHYQITESDRVNNLAASILWPLVWVFVVVVYLPFSGIYKATRALFLDTPDSFIWRRIFYGKHYKKL